MKYTLIFWTYIHRIHCFWNTLFSKKGLFFSFFFFKLFLFLWKFWRKKCSKWVFVCYSTFQTLTLYCSKFLFKLNIIQYYKLSFIWWPDLACLLLLGNMVWWSFGLCISESNTNQEGCYGWNVLNRCCVPKKRILK